MIFFFFFFQIVALLADPIPTCPNGFTVLNDDTCVKFFSNNTVHYQEALNTCKQFTGGHLVSIRNAIDNRALVNLAQGYNLPIWLGLICSGNSPEQCKWEDQRIYSNNYNSFNLGNPLVQIGSNVYLMATGNSTGKWISANGLLQSSAFFCEVPTNNAREFCINEFNGFCYSMKMNAVDEAGARNVCQMDCGDLVSIHSPEENEYIFQLFQNNPTYNQYRIGAMSGSNMTYWVDGSVFDYSNFGSYSVGVCSSVSLVKNDNTDVKQWMSISCDDEIPFACKRSKTATVC